MGIVAPKGDFFNDEQFLHHQNPNCKGQVRLPVIPYLIGNMRAGVSLAQIPAFAGMTAHAQRLQIILIRVKITFRETTPCYTYG